MSFKAEKDWIKSPGTHSSHFHKVCARKFLARIKQEDSKQQKSLSGKTWSIFHKTDPQ